MFKDHLFPLMNVEIITEEDWMRENERGAGWVKRMWMPAVLASSTHLLIKF